MLRLLTSLLIFYSLLLQLYTFLDGQRNRDIWSDNILNQKGPRLCCLPDRAEALTGRVISQLYGSRSNS